MWTLLKITCLVHRKSYLVIALIWPYVPYSPKIGILLLRQLFMEILHFKEFDDAESVATNAVWVFI